MSEAACGDSTAVAGIGGSPKGPMLAPFKPSDEASAAPQAGVQSVEKRRGICSQSHMEKTSSGSTQDLTPYSSSNDTAGPWCPKPPLPANKGCEGAGSPPLEDEDGLETVVKRGGIKPGMPHTIFHSEKYGFRLQVQKDSVPGQVQEGIAPDHLPESQTSGPIKVGPLNATEVFEGAELRGVLEVHCEPSKRRFDAPLLFDFPVRGGDKNSPIIDEYGRIRYEVLIKDCDSNGWIRDPECSIPLKVVKDAQGKMYVRAHVLHFSIWGLWEKLLNLGKQMFFEEKLPRSQRKRHQSIIKNDTEQGVRIHVFAMRIAHWEAAVESVEAGAGIKGVEANFGFGGNLHRTTTAAGKMPEMVTIPAGGWSHWFEIPRVGSGFTSSRKVKVAIVTLPNDEQDGCGMRLEAVLTLRSNRMLTVKLLVEDGKVVGPPAASGSGGIFAQVMRVMENEINERSASTPTSSGPTRSHSEANSSATDAASSVSVAPSTAAGWSGGRPVPGPMFRGATGATGSTALGDSDGEEEKSEDRVDPGGCDGLTDDEERSVSSVDAENDGIGGSDGSTDDRKQTASSPAAVSGQTSSIGTAADICPTTERVDRGRVHGLMEDEKQSTPSPATGDRSSTGVFPAYSGLSACAPGNHSPLMQSFG